MASPLARCPTAEFCVLVLILPSFQGFNRGHGQQDVQWLFIQILTIKGRFYTGSPAGNHLDVQWGGPAISTPDCPRTINVDYPDKAYKWQCAKAGFGISTSRAILNSRPPTGAWLLGPLRPPKLLRGIMFKLIAHYSIIISTDLAPKYKKYLSASNAGQYNGTPDAIGGDPDANIRIRQFQTKSAASAASSDPGVHIYYDWQKHNSTLQ
ncbi:hypothetical protein JB92DRAFT_2829866 [Gautieria morchelliformis]|nr:hypothetical protein JB92DRAFT_2829866 [Gautieria morchelliformis]